MNKARLAVAAGALIAGSGVYLWESRNGSEAPENAPQAVAPLAESGAPDAIVQRTPDEPPPIASVAPVVESRPPPTAEQRAIAIAHVMDALRPVYDDVGQEVGLDGPETEALLGLLAEQQLRLSDADIASTPADAAAHEQLNAEFQREIEEEFGPDRARRLSNYQESLNARYEVEEARRVLEDASRPLTETQKRTWVRSAIASGAFVRQPALTAGESSVALLQETLARTDQRDQKQLSLARGILDPEQFQLYEAHVTERRNRLDADIRRAEEQAIGR
jgi:hypothetical protein